MLNFEQPNAQFSSVLKAKSLAQLSLPYQKARLGSLKGRLGLIISIVSFLDNILSQIFSYHWHIWFLSLITGQWSPNLVDFKDRVM